ncbi:hypothetical protein [Novipirellula rosea]|uniref:Uncharacterized protein n=1 Tax=Novipirellula rosea TaxID=1031540 RepID=A0ABP8MLN4_9BACT
MNDSHQLETFIHSEKNLYGIITQLGDHIFCYTLYHYARQRYVISIDYDIFRSEVIEGFFMEPAINSPFDSVIRQLFDYHDFIETKRKPLVPDASTFEKDYARGYQTFRTRLIATMQRSEDNENA